MPLPRSLSRLALSALSLVFLGCSSLPELPFETSNDNPSTGGKKSGTGGSTSVPIGSGGKGSGTGGSSGPTAVCGNGELETGEVCDDGNTKSGDGCPSDCSTPDPDYDCSIPGQLCKDLVVCENGILEGNEVCDEGAANKTGACLNDCTAVAAGYVCPRPGFACVPLPVCGNGIRERGEQCDDGLAVPVSGDGCDTQCQEENPNGYFCLPGQLCIPKVCGDGTRTPNEACDDSNVMNGDGCSSACEVETGYRCGSSGCKAQCGDGLIIAGKEQCDDANRTSGDGCSSACLEESNLFSCSGQPSVCVSKVVCGNGKVDPGEVCDDGAGGDCVDPPATNACKAFIVVGIDPAVCGNNKLEYGEECEDSNTATNDGCDATCHVESGWTCPKKNYCYKLPECGDGILQPGETCDIGNYQNSAACIDCAAQPGFYCYGSAPSVCQVSVCGDGFQAKNEQCDDHNIASLDGCSSSCTVETGWVCPPEATCQPQCGDAILTGTEECERKPNDSALPSGCVNCKISAGYTCDLAGTTCQTASCGNSIKERGEGCDDGGKVAGDGCGPTCQLEPTVTRTGPNYIPVVQVACGDGLLTGSEQCDDGNTASGDGCSASCLEENGWTCSESITYPPSIDFQVTYRDFKYRASAGGHPDFESTGSSALGIPGSVCTTANSARCSTALGTACAADECGYLDAEGKPELHITPNATSAGTQTSANHFALWYRDTNTSNAKATDGSNVSMYHETGVLTLGQIGGATSDAYQYTSSSFFPLTGKGFGNEGGSTKNFAFTTELRYYFQYQGGETLDFEGDDDVWVFVNGRHAVDIGGVHCAQGGRVILGDEDSSCSLHKVDYVTSGTGNCGIVGTFPTCSRSATEIDDTTDDRFGLVKGNVYEIVLFQAERHTSASNFKLTLQGFLAPRSYCTTTCGDGKKAGTELCDEGNLGTSPADGVYNTDNIYNFCNTSCGYSFCGDGTKNSPDEACDNGKNINVYSAAGTGCAPGCFLPGKCGDGIVQASEGEVCDDGVNDNSYGGCKSDCKGFGGFCGDGTKNLPDEVCDTGASRVLYGNAGDCGFDCQPAPYCGDSIRNGQEQCDLGVASNGAMNSGCTVDCQIVGFCGDGITSQGEQCDNGTYNSGATPALAPYDGCSVGCQNGPNCGDGTIQASFEECDDGVNNVDSGYDQCTTSCALGPRCGDGELQSSFEACDNGFNEDTYAYVVDACGPNCTAVPYCGDGTVQSSFETCDNGVANDDSAYNGCKTNCEWGLFCGDGIKTAPQEACDKGVDNTSYSADGTGCGYDCQTAPYCGDGVRNGPEQCDLGNDTETTTPGTNDGSYGGCNADCTSAPRCGDKVIDKNNGEACDDGPSGSLNCSPTCQSRKVIK